MRRVRQLPRPPLFLGAPLFKNTTYNFIFLYIFFLKITIKLLRKVGNLGTNSFEDLFLEITIKLGRKVGNTRSIRSEDLFFRDHYDFGRRIGKYEIKDFFF